ncbi:AAA family ATPase [cf. Phormidesmis sp. LEGE 11477]|uniref:AAA family ATPase n=1 Tax=cf. Phormidesmis sp. LEGE 11477 TaxID=1828680 RepID=UPI0018824A76|nr:AAA family ATPase [cf. Phormidesmis sp. LEGE 11477]MBE9062313.1 AAA family ATPase [cf. Phormidesmis sp. LEGE 11477]
MQVSSQRLHQLEIKKLKNIKDFSISFESKNITGILGPNGYGKSTILHALACCFQPSDEDHEDYKFSNFFLPHPDALWTGSELKVVHTYKQERNLHDRVEKIYGKSSDRWKPRYVNRPVRNVYYFGVDSCVPLIEAEKRKGRIHYSTNQVSEDIVNLILRKASQCLNRQYTAYNIHDSGKGKKFIGVEANGVRYSALSMSAGEQKIFLLLEKIFRAEKYSLILIDELDLLLHDSAMKNLIEVVSERAESHCLQVVFTTHRESILEMSNLINIRHIFGTPDKTLCFNETKPDAINRLTGTQPRLIEIFVEDDLAVAIVKKAAAQLGISRHVSIQRFGAAVNCFTVLAGLVLSGQSCENSIFVLDGDVYRTEEDKIKQLKAVLTGSDNNAKSLRESSLSKVKCFNLPEGTKPEKYIHSIIIDLCPSNNEHLEIVNVAKQIIAVNNDHKYVDDIICRLDWDRRTGLSKIIDLVSTTSAWDIYVSDIKGWLQSKLALVEESL